MSIEIQKELKEIQELYKSNARSLTYNALIYGGMGVGKTKLLETCRKPVLVFSFDPGGTITIRDDIAKGDIIADTRYEEEDPKAPSAAELWDREYSRLKRAGVFKNIGTLAIDSGTTWASAIMNLTLKKSGRTGGVPQQNDYLPTMVVMENAIKDMCSLPCDFLFLCHEDTDKDEASGKMFIGPLLIGKLKYRIPILFDEVYCAMSKETSAGVNYHLLTRSTGLYKARTRLGRGNLFEMYEEQNIKKLLQKAGYDTSDKQLTPTTT